MYIKYFVCDERIRLCSLSYLNRINIFRVYFPPKRYMYLFKLNNRTEQPVNDVILIIFSVLFSAFVTFVLGTLYFCIEISYHEESSINSVQMYCLFTIWSGGLKENP